MDYHTQKLLSSPGAALVDDERHYQDALPAYSSLLKTVCTESARIDSEYGVPLAVERPPWYSRLHQNVLSGVLMGAFSYGYFRWRPFSAAATAVSFGYFMFGYSMMGAFCDDMHEQKIGMQAAETQRRADSKIVARILDTSFMNIKNEK
jgi:hypothetical protein